MIPNTPKCIQENMYKTATLKRTKIGFRDQLSLNAGQKYCRMLQGEHFAILPTFIKLPFVIKIFVLSTFEWPILHRFYCSLRYLMPFLILLEIAGCFTLIVFMLTRVSVAMGWSAVCDCGISWSYSLTFYGKFHWSKLGLYRLMLIRDTLICTAW